MPTLGIVGCGAIGGQIARTVQAWDRYDEILVHDQVPERASSLADEVGPAVSVPMGEACEADVVVEAASQDAVRTVGEQALANGATFVVMSVGALSDDALARDLAKRAEESDGDMLVPSGAIGGLDALAGARQAGLDEATLTTTKPPASLGMDDAAEREVLFEGPARRAVAEYPENVNVAAALSLAGVGFDETRVRIVVDPAVDRNTHRIEVAGAFGELTVEVKNEPSPENPKTSFLAALSVIGLLERLDGRVRIGT